MLTISRRTTRAALMLGCAVLGVVPAAAAPADAPAADAAAGAPADGSGADAGLAEITVTAEKRSTNLQKTPISISVVNGADLTNRHAQSLLDLGDGAIPSLRVAPFYSRPGALIVNIRGVGVLSDGNQPARDQGVGVYVDGVYLGRPQTLGAALYDIQNIEVLKGPQGTLFGRNTEGGAVSIVTKRPSGEFRVDATAGYGNYGGYNGNLHVDLPSFSNISLKFDAVATHRDPLVRNPLANASGFGRYDRRGVHVEAQWKPTPDFTADYSYDNSRDATTTLYLQLLAPGSLKLAAAATVQATRADVANVGVPEQPSIGKTSGHRVGLDWQATPNLLLKSIASYRELTQSQYDNGSAATTMANATGNFTGFNFSRYSLASFRQHQVSEEVQAIGDFDRLKFATGALFYQEKVGDNAQAFATNQFTDAAGSAYIVLPLDPKAQRIDRASHVKTTSIGVYGQGTYTPALADEIFHLTVGARYTRDKKVGSLYIVNGATPNVNGVIAPLPLDVTFSRVDPMVNLLVDVTRDVHVYGKFSTGYKSGGANSRSLTYAPFKPESVSIFEAGAKTEFFDHKARLNIAGYYGDYKKVQLDFSAQYQQVINGVLLTTTRTTTETANAPGKGHVRGVEAELTVAPATGLTLGASYAYTKVTIPDTKNPFPQTNGAFITVPIPIYSVYTPRHAASGSIDYELPLSGFTLRAHVDGNYDSGFYQGFVDPGFNTTTGQVTLKQPKGEAGFVVNGRLAVAEIALGQGRTALTLSLWARNLFDEQHIFYKAASPTAGLNGFFNERRTFGGEINVKF